MTKDDLVQATAEDDLSQNGQLHADEIDDQYDYTEPGDCDCLDAELDILTGRESCFRCGYSRWLSSEEFALRLKQNAEFEAAYYEEALASAQREGDRSELPCDGNQREP